MDFDKDLFSKLCIKLNECNMGPQHMFDEWKKGFKILAILP